MNLLVWVVLQRAGGEFLLGRRCGPVYGDGLWGLPGGQVEGSEALTLAAAREVREEVGLAVVNLEFLGVLRYEFPEVRGVDFLFLSRRWQGQPEPLDKTSEVGWFTLETLPTDVLPWLPGVLKAHLGAQAALTEQLQTPQNVISMPRAAL